MTDHESFSGSERGENVLDDSQFDSLSSSDDEVEAPMAYAFEPMREPGATSSEDEASSPESEMSDSASVREDSSRLHALDWCKCGHCVLMPTEKESICCREVDQFMCKVQDLDIECVTDNGYFTTLCVDREVLDVAMLQVRDVRGDLLIRPVPSRFVYLQNCLSFSSG